MLRAIKQHCSILFHCIQRGPQLQTPHWWRHSSCDQKQTWSCLLYRSWRTSHGWRHVIALVQDTNELACTPYTSAPNPQMKTSCNFNAKWLPRAKFTLPRQANLKQNILLRNVRNHLRWSKIWHPSIVNTYVCLNNDYSPENEPDLLGAPRDQHSITQLSIL